MIEPIKPSVWRSASRKTARNVSAVRIANGEYQACPPGVVRGAVCQTAIASSVNQTVKLPHLAMLYRQQAKPDVDFAIDKPPFWCRPKRRMRLRLGEHIRTTSTNRILPRIRDYGAIVSRYPAGNAAQWRCVGIALRK